MQIGEICNARIEDVTVAVRVVSDKLPVAQPRAGGTSFPSINDAIWYCKVVRIDNGKELTLPIDALAKRD